MRKNLLIKNAKIVLENSIYEGSILIKEGKINRLIPTHKPTPKTVNTIDAEGKYVFPGGIDPHVHFHLKTSNGYSADNFYTGSKAALYGGTTCIIDFITTKKGQSLIEAIQLRKEEAKESLTDYSFHLTPVEWKVDSAKEIIQSIHNEYITSFKVYMAYKESIGLEDKDIEHVMRTLGKFGGVLLVHAELGDEITQNQKMLLKEGKKEAKYHPISRPPQTEIEAIEKIVKKAIQHKCPLYIVHTSCGSSLDNILDYLKQNTKTPIFFETCPQYLLFDDSVYQKNQSSALPFIMSPPIRNMEEKNKLRTHLFENHIHTIGTDHCPFNWKEKLAHADDFTKIPNGAGGVEYRLQILFNEMVVKEGLSIVKFVKNISTNAAMIFGLYPEKGVIQSGSDADLVIWDAEKEFTIDIKNQKQNTDINIYQAYQGKGTPSMVIKKGELIIKDNIIQKEVKGEFIKRKVFENIKL